MRIRPRSSPHNRYEGVASATGIGGALLLGTLIAAVPLLGPAVRYCTACAVSSHYPCRCPSRQRADSDWSAGDDCRSVVRGRRGPLSNVTPVLTITAGAEHKTVAMSALGGAFEYVIPALDRTFSYQVSAGRAHSADYSVTALSAPRVTRIDLGHVYPSFVGLAPREEQDGGDIYAPAGTRVRLRVHADKPLVAGQLTLSGDRTVPFRPASDGTGEAEIILASDDSYRVSLADRDGLHSARGSQYFIRIMDDRPPTVRVLRPSSDQQITPLEEIAVEARADDDYGISSLDLVYSVGGGAARTVPFAKLTGTPLERVGSTLVSAEALGVKPGDVISYYARAVDVGRGKRATRATSDIFFLEVKPFSEEFVLAESAAAGQAPGGSMDSLVDAQKQIIASTWNIERRTMCRSIVGRCPHGCGGAGCAQVARGANLLVSSDAVAARRHPREREPATGRGRRVRSDSRGGAGDGQAVPAAARPRRTAEALPHEMAALNALLQAQAEARRREVLQQTGERRRETAAAGRARTCPHSSTRNCSGSSRRTTRHRRTRRTVDQRAGCERRAVRPAPGSRAQAGGVEPAPGGAGRSGSLRSRCSVSSKS